MEDQGSQDALIRAITEHFALKCEKIEAGAPQQIDMRLDGDLRVRKVDHDRAGRPAKEV
jgi:hypothetical protein